MQRITSPVLFVKYFLEKFIGIACMKKMRTVASAFLLVLTLVVQNNQENNIPSILFTLGIGLQIFCLVQKIRPVTDFGLFEFFISKSVGIMCNIYGFKSLQTLGFSVFCVVLIGVYYWMEVEEKFSKIPRSRCFIDISIANIPEGRIVFELYEELAPNTVKNFKSFCIGGHYKKTTFHQINSRSVMIGGEELFSVDDSGIIKKVECKHDLHHIGENSSLKHDQAGLLSTPVDTNGSKFLITMAACAEYNINSMVFGKVVKGMSLLKEIEKVTVDSEYRFIKPVEIVNCGEILEGGDQDDFNNLFGEKNQYPDWPQDIVVKEKEFTWWLAAVGSLQILGSAEKKMRNYERAVVKYKKAQRYLEVCSTDESVDKASDLILEEFKSELSNAIEECLWKLEESKMKLLQKKRLMVHKEPCKSQDR